MEKGPPRRLQTSSDELGSDLPESLMRAFARNTGVEPARNKPARYLWTDAFAICNYLGFYERRKDRKSLDLAVRLVDQVHHSLGRHRTDDKRKGWISGLSAGEGEKHPTSGGLRIGKPHNERGPDEPQDDEAEWEQDGQYFHYLTRWMHALIRIGRVTSDPRYVIWAAELAKRAHAGFVYSVPDIAEKRMYWKMSIDLSRPLVRSMGQHDPLDGLVTYLQLQEAMGELVGVKGRPSLDREISEIAGICQSVDILTDDPLGIGGLLSDACYVCQLVEKGSKAQTRLLDRMLKASSIGLGYFMEGKTLGLPAEYRLAFRELGLAIGIKGVELMREIVEADRDRFSDARKLDSQLYSIARRSSVATHIERFWTDEVNQNASTWLEHDDINTVMLATCLEPDSFLSI